MKILILGGNRFVGQRLAENLVNEYSVTVFNRKGTGPEGATIVKGDRNIADDLNQLLFDSFDLVIDFCLFKPEQFELMKPLISSTTKYIFISSASVGRPEWGAYGKEKEDCELLVENHFEDYLIIRPPYIDGENSHRPRTAQIVNQIENNQPVTIEGDGEYLINIVWVDDMVDFILNEMFNIELGRRVVKVSSPLNFTMNEYIHLVASFLRKEVTIQEGEPFWAPALDLDMGDNSEDEKLNPVASKLYDFLQWYNIKGKEKYGY